MKIIMFVNTLLLSVFLNAQQGEITYETTHINLMENPTDFALSIEKELNNSLFSLQYTNKESFFTNIPHVPEDDLMAKLALVKAHYYEDWYQSPTNKISYFNKEIAGKEYLVVYKRLMQGWKLSNVSKKIENYTCYKATLVDFNERSGNETIIEAWYTPDIALPYGPGGYGGLPGLILELRYKQCLYVASKITLNPVKEIKEYPRPNMKNQIDSKEMARLMKLARKVTED